MFLKRTGGPRTVKLPDGSIMTLADLPPADTRRWVASRKMAVVRGVIHGLITQEEAQEAYDISREEFQEWLEAVSRDGPDGLKATSPKKRGQP